MQPPKLLSLANELLYQIIDEVTPNDIVGLALTCKSVHWLCQDYEILQQHKQRRQCYINLIVCDCGLHRKKLQPRSIVHKICEDWHVAYYVQTMALTELHTESDDDDYIVWEGDAVESVVASHFIDKHRKDIRYLLDSSQYSKGLSTDDQRTLIKVSENLEKGGRDAMIAMLPLILPNLRQIKMTGRTGESAFVNSLI